VTDEQYNKLIQHVKALALSVDDVRNKRNKSILTIWLEDLRAELLAEINARDERGAVDVARNPLGKAVR